MTQPETYGINLTPHFEKYQSQDEETADIMHKTWNFGNVLKMNGYKVAYMHGPVGLFEGQIVTAEPHFLEANSGYDPVGAKKSNLERFIDDYPDKEKFLFFLYQKRTDSIRMARLERAQVEAARKLRPKKKKKVVKKINLAVDKPL